MKTLLQKAKEIHTTRNKVKIDPQLIELTVAWLNDEIDSSQASIAVFGKRMGSIKYTFANVLKDLYKQGKLIVKE